MEEGSGEMPEQESVTISADLLGGVPVKAGAKLLFCATSDPDENGNVQGYFEPSETEVEKEVEEDIPNSESDKWKGDLKAALTEAKEGI